MTSASSSSYVQSQRDLVPVRIRRPSLQLPAPRTQADNLKDINWRRSIFLKANQNLIKPLVGNSLRDNLASTLDCSDLKPVPYVLGSQPQRQVKLLSPLMARRQTNVPFQ
jgi:hypothetical protein